MRKILVAFALIGAFVAPVFAAHANDLSPPGITTVSGYSDTHQSSIKLFGKKTGDSPILAVSRRDPSWLMARHDPGDTSIKLFVQAKPRTFPAALASGNACMSCHSGTPSGSHSPVLGKSGSPPGLLASAFARSDHEWMDKGGCCGLMASSSVSFSPGALAFTFIDPSEFAPGAT